MIDKAILGVAAEFAVASEICRRGIYAQLTLGNRKRTDLLIDMDTGMTRIQVKAKQGRVWPGCRGVSGQDILILVDYEKKSDSERPDFYILSAEDWLNLLKTNFEDALKKGELEIKHDNTPFWIRQGYVGHSTPVKHVLPYKEAWNKIINFTKK